MRCLPFLLSDPERLTAVVHRHMAYVNPTTARVVLLVELKDQLVEFEIRFDPVEQIFVADALDLEVYCVTFGMLLGGEVSLPTCVGVGQSEALPP